MKKKIEISVFVRGVAKHLNQIYSGLYDLHRLGKIQLRLESGKSAEDIDEDREILKVMVRSLDEGKLQRICFDMGDGGREAYNLPARVVDIDASGTSKAWIRVSESLRVDASGACHIYYKGGPSTDIRLSGTSKVVQE